MKVRTEAHRLTRYTRTSPKLTETLRLAVLSDLHNGAFEDVLPALAQCDAVLFPGDLLDRHRPGMEHVRRFLEEVPRVAPVFFSMGNHEWKSPEADSFRRLLGQSDVCLLDNTLTTFRGLTLGGWSSARKAKIDHTLPQRLADCDGFRLLLCHHPEWYPRYLRGSGIDLTVSGHAHGGQVQLFGHGLYAPDQWFFPRWTNGFYEDGHLLVSRGMTNTRPEIPRLNNPCELLLLTLLPGAEDWADT